ncbi:MAG: hypothetical protein WD049_04250 [Candidatus Paceibacterota bacterium]
MAFKTSIFSFVLVFALVFSLGAGVAFAQEEDLIPGDGDTSTSSAEDGSDEEEGQEPADGQDEGEQPASESEPEPEPAPIEDDSPLDTTTPQESEEEEAEQKRVIDERRELDQEELERDTDNDGVSDFDEVRIYGTDPENPDTSGNGLTDGQMIEMGLDPTSTSTTARVRYEDPREEPDVSFSEEYLLTEIAHELSADGVRVEATRFAGVAQPHSYVTLYVFSTPIVVTVRSDNAGSWSYTLREELPDGSHEVYTANVNNSGRILARSASIPFTKEAGAITVGSSPSAAITNVADQSVVGFFVDNFTLLSLLILLVILCVAIIIVGLREEKNVEEEMV